MKKSNFSGLTLAFIFIVILFACNNSKKPKYSPKEGQPNLNLFTGKWQGSVKGFTYNSSSETSFNGVLEMDGDFAGQSDVLYFNPINETSKNGMVNKIRIFNNQVNYLTNDYKTSIWQQKDSLHFNWFLLGNSYNDDRIGRYKNFARFKRKKDSLFITTGRMILADSTFSINYYYRYQKLD